MAKTRAPLRMADVEERTGISVRTLRHWRYHGIGPRSYRLGRFVVYDEDEVERWIAEQRDLTGVGGQDGALSV